LEDFVALRIISSDLVLAPLQVRSPSAGLPGIRFFSGIPRIHADSCTRRLKSAPPFPLICPPKSPRTLLKFSEQSPHNKPRSRGRPLTALVSFLTRSFPAPRVTSTTSCLPSLTRRPSHVSVFRVYCSSSPLPFYDIKPGRGASWPPLIFPRSSLAVTYRHYNPLLALLKLIWCGI